MQEGTQVGSYRMLYRIGEGGMGSVWLAEHSVLGRRAAIKVLHHEYTSRAEIVTRFFNEARAATAIADPGIVQIFDVGHHADGSAYIIMELLDGEPLDKRLARRGALELPEGLRIMRQVASSLGAAHARGIVHRDLKPENVFIVRDPEVAGGERAKVLDFGIAKLMGDHAGVKTKTATMMGTPTYMSPEQCRGAGQVDPRSDVYALGCLMFTVLIGRPPFDSDGAGEIIAMHLRETPPVPSSLRAGIPPEVDQLVLRCLAKDPAQRFDHGAALALALGGLSGSSPHGGTLGSGALYVASPSTSLLAAASDAILVDSGKRRRWPVLVGLGIAAAGGVIAAAVTRGGSDRPGAEPAPVSAQAAASLVAPAPAPGSAQAPAGSAAPSPAPAQESGGAAPEAEVAARTDPGAEVAERAKEVLARFVAWSRDHRGAPCPAIAALDDAPRDPWGRAFRLTCTEQPDDQIIGAVSAGPDGKPGTTDDIASWKLDREVTELVQGARWGVAALPPRTRPAKGTRPKPVERPKRIQLDENGLPINR